MFGEVVSDLWLVDRTYFTPDSMTRARPLLDRDPGWELFEVQFEGPPSATREWRTDERGRRYRHLEPGTRSEHYRRVGTGHELAIHRRRGYAQISIEKVRDLAVHFHRGDSPGEGGSGIEWLSRRRHELLLGRMRSPGLVVSDGSLARIDVLEELARMTSDPVEVARAAPTFTKWGWHWECVGWAPPRRESKATLVWKVQAVEDPSSEVHSPRGRIA